MERFPEKMEENRKEMKRTLIHEIIIHHSSHGQNSFFPVAIVHR
jgi:hypothetical protein